MSSTKFEHRQDPTPVPPSFIIRGPDTPPPPYTPPIPSLSHFTPPATSHLPIKAASPPPSSETEPSPGQNPRLGLMTYSVAASLLTVLCILGFSFSWPSDQYMAMVFFMIGWQLGSLLWWQTALVIYRLGVDGYNPNRWDSFTIKAAPLWLGLVTILAITGLVILSVGKV